MGAALFRWSGQAAWQRIAGRVVIAAARSHSIHELNEVGSFVWEVLEEPCSVEEVARRILDEYEVDYDRAREDAAGFVEQMRDRGLLEEAGAAGGRGE